jgi:hypothetical protein
MQAEQALCRTLDESGSLELLYEGPIHAVVARRIPTEAEALDSDGTVIHYLLHVSEGKIHELEIFREDSLPTQRRPAPEELSLLSLD